MTTESPSDPEYHRAEPVEPVKPAERGRIDIVVDDDIDQIGRDIVVAHKQVDYADGKNFISVIISAISVRINMPRGTVKALMACFLALLIAAGIYGINVLRSWDEPYEQGADHQRGIERIKSGIESGDCEETARQVFSTVHRTKNAYTNDELVAKDKAEWEDMYGDLDYEELYEEYMNDPESFYDSAGPDAMGVDPYEAARPDDDEWKKQQVEEAWEEYNKTEPDISDGVIKP